jgi:hypothetical protein
MKEEKYIWEDDRFRKEPYTLPDGYFASFPERMLERLNQEVTPRPESRIRHLRPWMAWVSGIAAALVIGWIGIRQFYVKPHQETNMQETIDLFVDLYSDELTEGQLANYLADNKIDIKVGKVNDVSAIVQSDPDLVEMYLYESVGK